MAQEHGKRFTKLAADYDREKLYDAVEATSIVKKNANADRKSVV